MDSQEDLPLPASATDSLEAVTAAADDFGHTVHHVPALVCAPDDASEVAEAIQYARRAGTALVPRGAGHSVHGQAQADGGIVCGLSGLSAVAVTSLDSDTDTDTGSVARPGSWAGAPAIAAGAGARWSDVLDAALAYGLTPPVLPDYLELSVGGTLSVGGIGGASHVYGPIADHVRSLDLVTADGSRVTECSSEYQPGLFAGALGTGGAGGVITSAVLPLVPAPVTVRVHQVPCLDVAALTAVQLQAVRSQRFGYVEGQITLSEYGTWAFTAELGTYLASGEEAEPVPGDGVTVEDVAYRDFCHRMAPGVRLLAATGDWYRPHPWFSAFLPDDTVNDYVNTALAEMSAATVGPIPTLLYPMRRGQVPAPGLATPTGDKDGLFFAFTILRSTATPEALDAALASNERLAQAAEEAGGTVYRISALPTGTR